MASSWREPDPADWPPLAEALRIIDNDLRAMPEAPVCISIRQEDAAWIGTMWQQGPNGERSEQIGAVGHSQQEVVRHLAAIIAANRIGGV